MNEGVPLFERMSRTNKIRFLRTRIKELQLTIVAEERIMKDKKREPAQSLYIINEYKRALQDTKKQLRDLEHGKHSERK